MADWRELLQQAQKMMRQQWPRLFSQKNQTADEEEAPLTAADVDLVRKYEMLDVYRACLENVDQERDGEAFKTWRAQMVEHVRTIYNNAELNAELNAGSRRMQMQS